jgi:hypothetical protein
MMCLLTTEIRNCYSGGGMIKSSEQMQIQTWPIDRLVFYARNPRKDDSAVDRMCSSIREFGFKIPVLARSDGEVVDGHLRLKAARKLGITDVPVILCDEWSPAQVKAFRLMVNRSVTWADWDEELLALELQELSKSCRQRFESYGQSDRNRGYRSPGFGTGTGCQAVTCGAREVMRALASRLEALESRLIEPSEPRKSLLPHWLIEELKKQGVRFDAFGYPKKIGMESGSTSAVKRNSTCLA